MSEEEAQEEPAKVQEGGEPDPLTVVLDRLEAINLTLFLMDQRLQEVEKPPLPRSELKELDSRRNSHDGLNISHLHIFWEKCIFKSNSSLCITITQFDSSSTNVASRDLATKCTTN